jgi:hypothetical protein
MLNEKITKQIKSLVEDYREYADVYSYSYRHTKFGDGDDFMVTIREHMAEIMENISYSLYDAFIADNNLMENDYDSIDELRYTDDMIELIGNDYSYLDLDFSREWLTKIITEYFSNEFEIKDDDTLRIIFEN